MPTAGGYDTGMPRTAFVFDEHMGDYDLGDDHPLSPLRRQLAVELIRAYGMLDDPDVTLVSPHAASDAEIERAHAAAYVAAVRRLSAQPVLSQGQAALRA